MQHASPPIAAPRVANYSKYKPLKQKLIGQMVESHTKQQSPETVPEMELRAKRLKSTGLRARTREREQWRIFSGGN